MTLIGGPAEVPDLTHPANVELFQKWDQKELAYIDLLRFIRIFSTDPKLVVVSRPGKHLTLVARNTDPPQGREMYVDLADRTVQLPS
jgi:translation machinery-associated protein 16